MSESRMVRDPIHGDVGLTALESAVVDTRIFQRLRYIRQNGLLHFVFPGAVHTRFMHSLGTLHVAGRVAQQLLGELSGKAQDDESDAIDYVSAVFRLAALLHDVGHCAFSHSMETVELEGKPILGIVRTRFKDWDAAETLARCEAVNVDLDAAANHELLGLALVEKLMADERVVSHASRLGWPAVDLAHDVQCLMHGGIKPSTALLEHLAGVKGLYQRCVGEEDLSSFAEDMIGILHNLVSGTLDVDRLDYLARDSHFCGVPYGRCDSEMLVRSLSLGTIAGSGGTSNAKPYLELLLSEKAVPTFEDFLWSRYQMFAQVYNHKTNVALNTVLSQAIEAAVDDDRISAPSSLKDYLGFTDDYLMSQIISSCLRGKLADTSYAKTLVDRRIPRYLGYVEGGIADPQVTERRAKLAGEYSVDVERILRGRAKSDLIKEAPLPMILGKANSRGSKSAPRGYTPQTITTKRSYSAVHFYIDESFLAANTSATEEHANA